MRRGAGRAALAIAAVAGCGYDPLPGIGGDGAIKGTADTVADEAHTFVPVHVLPETLISGAPDLVLGPDAASIVPSIVTSIDTTALTIDGEANPFFVRQGEYAILFTNALSVQGPVTIAGASPLIVVASGQVTVLASISLGAVGRTAGPGAAAGDPGGGTAGKSVLLVERASSGGGGAGHGTVGARGGTKDQDAIPAGTGGARYAGRPTDPLVGGSRGGDGGFVTSGGAGAAGAGGGALQISSAISIAVGSEGKIVAGGGGGAGGKVGFAGGGGGGSGGTILLEAPSIAVAGRLVANGGGGGGGGSGGGSTTPGGDGDDGGVDEAPAAGGTGGIPQGSDGGTGAAGVAGAFTQARAGSGGNSKAGGGGGGVGRIWLRHRAATSPDLTGALVSPPAVLDPSLP